jgi:hypothetical protein
MTEAYLYSENFGCHPRRYAWDGLYDSISSLWLQGIFFHIPLLYWSKADGCIRFSLLFVVARVSLYAHKPWHPRIKSLS